MALAANQKDGTAQAYLADNKIHASETAWVGTKFDAEIDNNGTLAELYAQVDKLL
jgi:hypothetical protein